MLVSELVRHMDFLLSEPANCGLDNSLHGTL
jgi:hypothetical protein